MTATLTAVRNLTATATAMYLLGRDDIGDSAQTARRQVIAEARSLGVTDGQIAAEVMKGNVDALTA